MYMCFKILGKRKKYVFIYIYILENKSHICTIMHYVVSGMCHVQYYMFNNELLLPFNNVIVNFEELAQYHSQNI